MMDENTSTRATKLLQQIALLAGSLVFALLLVLPIVLLQKPLSARFDPRPTKMTRPKTWLASLDSLTLGASMFFLQVII